MPPKIQYLNEPTTLYGWNVVMKKIKNFIQENEPTYEDTLKFFYIISFTNDCTDAEITVYTWDGTQLCEAEKTTASSYPARLKNRGQLIKRENN